MKHDGILQHEGIDIHEGLVSHEGIDLDNVTLPARRYPRTKHEVQKKTFPGRRAYPKKKKEQTPYIPLAKKERPRWAVSVILPDGVAAQGGGGGSSGSGGNGKQPKKNAYMERLAVLATKGYSRRCTVRFRYTNPGKKVFGSKVIASYAGVKGQMSTSQYNRGMVGYISRHEAAIDNNPEWEEAKEDKPLFTVIDGRKVMLSAQDAYDILGDSAVFTVIVSPEDEGADPADLADRFMMKLESKLHQEHIPWVGATHHNTDHTHVHLVVKREVRDKVLEIPGSYIRQGARKDCEKILTEMIGERTWEDELRCDRLQAATRRFTKTDRMILALSKLDKDHPGDLPPHRFRSKPDHEATLIEERLKVLRKMRLVSCSSDGVWHIKPGLEDGLRKQEFKETLKLEDVSDCVLDKGKKSYMGKVVRMARPEDEENRVLMLIIGEDGLKHLRTDRIDTENGETPPEGIVDVTKIPALIRGSVGGKVR